MTTGTSINIIASQYDDKDNYMVGRKLRSLAMEMIGLVKRFIKNYEA
jgi:hypothetical protein